MCDEHYVGKKPSLDPLHPAFAFRQQEDQAKNMRRYESVKKRASCALSSTIIEKEFTELEEYPYNDEDLLHSTSNVHDVQQTTDVLDISSVSPVDFDM